MKFCDLNKSTKDCGGKALGLRKLIESGVTVPKGIAIKASDLEEVINQENELNEICKNFSENEFLAVRSSALNEDGTNQSFAGLYHTETNVKNDPESLKEALKIVYKSSLSGEIQKYSGNEQDKMGVVVQKMIQPKYSGVIFTEATEINGDNCCLIELVRGFGEQLVSGHAETTRIIAQYDESGNLEKEANRIEGSVQDSTIFPLLFPSLNKINRHFKRGMDVEFCIDKNNNVFCVQARPITRHILIPEIDRKNGTVASIGKCKAKSYVIDSDLDDEKLLASIRSFQDGCILIAPFTDTQYMPAINKAVGIITEEGSILSHAAIISREKGIPCIVGMADAAKLFPTGTEVTLDTANRIVYSNEYTSKCDERDFDWESLYIFTNLTERKNIGDCEIKVEKSPIDNNTVAVHIPEEVSSSDYNNIEYYIRKKYKQVAKFVSSEKYLWFDEYDRFLAFPEFRKYLTKGIENCENMDSLQLKEYYNQILDQTKTLLERKKTSNSLFEAFLCEEKMASMHLLADLIIPAGYGLLSVYAETKKEKADFNQFIKGTFDSSNKNLSKAFDFMTTLAEYRNTICQKFVDIGAYNFSYFDDREERAGIAINNASSETPVQDFYDILKKNSDMLKQKTDSSKEKKL